MNNGYILMTAMPVSIGHKALINWARNFSIGKLTVLVCGRPFDPLPLNDRVEALRSAFQWTQEAKVFNTPVYITPILHDLPDYPEQFDGPVEAFDKLWVDEIRKYADYDNYDFLFASDTYGARFAKNLGMNFAPYDPNRETLNISGTKIRRDPFNNFKYILPELQPTLRKTVTVFGAESTGKTTMTKKLATKFNSPFVAEWARPYLESLDSPEVTDERMELIFRGQLASQKAAKSLVGNPFIFQDTDLYSTVGYYNIYGGGNEITRTQCKIGAEVWKSDLYIVMNSNIRFTPDPLRYGITKRESNDAFWIDILESNDCEYHYVKSVNPVAQEEEVFKVVEEYFRHENPVFGFERV